jgi:uncharacterized damage-inducible protein DinB
LLAFFRARGLARVKDFEMNAEYFRLLFDYNAWANHRLLDACQPLSVEQFTRDLRSSFPSVRDTLAHIAGGEWLYLERFLRDRSPDKMPSRDQYPDLASLRSKWAEIETDLSGAIGGLTDAGLARIVHYRNTRGTPFATPLPELLQHLANHSTYHRGQVTTMLRQLGAKAVGLDLIYYWRENPDGFPGAAIDPETLRELYEYEAWANERMLEACARLAPEQLTRDLGSSFPSVRDTVTHIIAGQWVWLERFLGRTPTAFPDFLKGVSLDALVAHSNEIGAGLQAFVAPLNGDTLARNHEYKTFAGAAFANPTWVSLRHLVNHGAYHRGQITTMLRQLGADPVSTDLIYFYRERAGVPLN